MQKANAERAVPEAAAPAKRPRIDSASPLPASVAAGGFLATCSDLVQLILSLIPRRPRLLVASLVCKRWRAAALRTVTHTHMRSRDSVRAFDLLPNLTSISFSPGFLMSASAPARITHLSIKPPVGPTDLLDAAPLASLTRLTSIKLYVSTSTPKLIALLATHASTIQSLRLTVFDLAPANQLPLLPQLRHLECRGHPEHVTDLVRATGTQLHSLRIECDAGNIHILLASVSYPVLRTLSLPRLPSGLALSAPLITRLGLTACAAAPDAAAPDAASLVECDARSLTLPGRYPSLRTLRLILHRVSYDSALRGLEAPALRTLYVQVERKSLGGEFMALITRLLTQFPSIRKLDLIAAIPPKGAQGRWSFVAPQQREMLALLRTVEAAGVERLRMPGPVPSIELINKSLRVSQLPEWSVRLL